MMRAALLVAIALMVTMGSIANGAISIQGSTENFTNEGIYTFDFAATAVGQSYTIIGFTIPLQNLNGSSPLVENPDISLSDIQFTPNPLLELRLASSDFIGSGFGFSISAQDNNGSPLVLNDGESVVLFSIPMNVLGPGEVLGENIPLAGLQTITTTAGPASLQSIGSASAVAIPEPGSALALTLAAGIAATSRRRRAG